MDTVATALAGAAVDPKLAGVLFLDADPARLREYADWYAALFDPAPATTVVGTATRDEHLWTRFRLEPTGFRVEPGPLFDDAVVLVPDLTRLSRAGSHAAVTTIGADVIHLERDGIRYRGVPRARWLAACRREDLPRLSRHLLDRFPLRVDAAPAVDPLPEPPRRWLSAIRTARPPTPDLDAARLDRVLECLRPHGGGIRRELALARLARSIAVLDGAETVSDRHVDTAAHVLGLPPLEPEPAPGSPAPTHLEPLPAPSPTGDRPTPPPRSITRDVAIGESGTLPRTTAAVRPSAPYPEDAAPMSPTLSQLAPAPAHPRTGARGDHGRAWGTAPARELHDLAITASIVEALKHQRRRCPRHFEESHPVHVTPDDLRRHRRGFRATEQFVLLLDHTCRGDWDLTATIGPYVRWAYETRAEIHVVEVGAAGAAAELTATHFAARNPLDRRFHDALDRRPGRATPLAHGMDLAARLLRDSVRRGRSATTEAVFVLVTDGRGNVPISASLTGTIEVPVGRRGVDDTLTVADRIRTLNRVHTVVAAPPRAAGGTLIASLATALDAPIVGVGAHG